MKPVMLVMALSSTLLAGCGAEEEAQQDAPILVAKSAQLDADEELEFIVKTMAEILMIPKSQLKPDVPLNQLDPPMDELDLVELILELEDHFGITIPDEAITGDAVDSSPRALVRQHTLISLAIVTHRCREDPQ